MGYEDIIFTKESMVATVRFNRPQAMNAFSPQMMDEIFQAIEEVRNDQEARVLVFASTGRSFSTGADVKAMAERSAGQAKDQRKRTIPGNNGPNLALTIRNLDKPFYY